MELQPSIRASDSDREDVAKGLRHATSEGRLTSDELEERLEALYTARTYAELDALVADLPIARSERQPALRLRRRVAAVGVVTLVLLGVIGILALARHRSAAAVINGGHLRDFNLPGPFADPRDSLALAASAGAGLVVLLACAAVVWGIVGSKSTHAH